MRHVLKTGARFLIPKYTYCICISDLSRNCLCLFTVRMWHNVLCFYESCIYIYVLKKQMFRKIMFIVINPIKMNSSISSKYIYAFVSIYFYFTI